MIKLLTITMSVSSSCTPEYVAEAGAKKQRGLKELEAYLNEGYTIISQVQYEGLGYVVVEYVLYTGIKVQE